MTDYEQIRVPCYEGEATTRPGLYDGRAVHMSLPDIRVEPMRGARMVKMIVEGRTYVVDAYALLKAIDNAQMEGIRR